MSLQMGEVPGRGGGQAGDRLQVSCLEGFPEEGASEMRAKRRGGVRLRKGGGKGWGKGSKQRDQHMHKPEVRGPGVQVVSVCVCVWMLAH